MYFNIMPKYTDPKANTYSLVEFQSKYGTEESCEQALFQLKWPEGFKCPKCGFCHCTVVGGRRFPLYQCPICRHQTSATAGTIMANTKLPLTKWFLALCFAATNGPDEIHGRHFKDRLGPPAQDTQRHGRTRGPVPSRRVR